MKYLKEFLLKNGFIEWKQYKTYKNDLCYIDVISDTDSKDEICQLYRITYTKKDETGSWEVYSDNLSIHWLIGYLTYNGLMDKNYNQ